MSSQSLKTAQDLNPDREYVLQLLESLCSGNRLRRERLVPQHRFSSKQTETASYPVCTRMRSSQ